MSAWEIRRGASRGSLRSDWLDARFSFSFGTYDDPLRRRFGPLVALNEDRVRPGTGFPMHPHRDLEIVMLPLSGEVEHHDDLGGHALVRPGQWQWMRAGSGLRHRQWNPSPREPDHHLQIWLEPVQKDLRPQVQTFDIGAPTPGTWHTLVAHEPTAGALDVGVDVTLSLGEARADRSLRCEAHPGGRYLHVIDGPVDAVMQGQRVATLEAGDALVFFDAAPDLEWRATGRCRLLRFDTLPVERETGRFLHLS